MTAEVLIDKIEYQLTKEWKNAESLVNAIKKCIKEFDDDAPYKEQYIGSTEDYLYEQEESGGYLKVV